MPVAILLAALGPGLSVIGLFAIIVIAVLILRVV
jgi:hypothetical protein